jgi:hypothetical protein
MLEKVLKLAHISMTVRFETPGIRKFTPTDTYWACSEKAETYSFGFILKICTVSGNWFEHFSKFVEGLLYVSCYKFAGLQ